MVSGLDAAVERVTEGGGRITHAPSEVPGGGWIAHCLDPQGAAFALLSDQR
ncbi:MAG: glyoxalase, partial [Sphingomonas bacterium]|nr:glyoxalase [Sphingomonas bacterium]